MLGCSLIRHLKARSCLARPLQFLRGPSRAVQRCRLFIAAHRESGGGEKGDHQLMAFHECVFGCASSLPLLVVTEAGREHPRRRRRHEGFAKDERNPFFDGSLAGGHVAAQFELAAEVPDGLSVAKRGEDVIIAVAVIAPEVYFPGHNFRLSSGSRPATHRWIVGGCFPMTDSSERREKSNQQSPNAARSDRNGSWQRRP